jgi:hypothetical protein
MMAFNFDDLFNTETINIGMIGDNIFSVTVREIPHGEIASLQSKLFGKIPLDSKKAKKRVADGTYDAVALNDERTLLGIKSWTLVDSDNAPVPICIEAFHALPHRITEQIEEAITRLNPSLDEEFQDDAES